VDHGEHSGVIALAFSGGKDSLACWYLRREEIDVVLWVNTGKGYPETLAVVDMVRKDAKRFIEIRSDQEAQNRRHGIPSDLLPVDWTAMGVSVSRPKQYLVQNYIMCCYENIAAPLMAKARELGVTKLIRGQRRDETHKATSVGGDMLDGITFVHPIEDWSREQVLDYLRDQMGELPEHFTLDHTSMDCYDCTAFLAHSADRAKWTRERHPQLYRRYRARLEMLKVAVAPSVAAFEEVCNA
jgi:3'-phosphoadenosine 5'-phosphosulfate sulfotransferase (PAPS reductase)/FAD synthetase